MINIERLASERGSIPMALLAIIVVSSVVSVVIARTISESRATQFDNEYTTVLHVAEAGLDDALFHLNNRLFAPTASRIPQDPGEEMEGTVNGLEFRWFAERQADDSWVATSTGTGWNDVERTLVAEIRDQPIFALTLATHLGVTFTGSNSADSYDSTVAKSDYCSYGKSPSPSCYGIVASNGTVNLTGASNFVDRVHIHDFVANPTNRCVRPANQNPQFCQDPYRFNFDDPLDVHRSVTLVEELVALHCPDPPPDLTVPQKTTVTLDPDDADLWGDQASPTLNGEINGKGAHVRCVNDIVIGHQAVVPLHDDITVEEPLVVLVTGRVNIDHQVRVHCPECDEGTGPAARKLTIFSLSGDTGGNQVVAIGNHTKIGAAIYAPNGTCGSQNANAQVDIYGSMVCSSVANNGGWSFHYDEDLGSGFTTGLYFVSRWTET